MRLSSYTEAVLDVVLLKIPSCFAYLVQMLLRQPLCRLLLYNCQFRAMHNSHAYACSFLLVSIAWVRAWGPCQATASCITT